MATPYLWVASLCLASIVIGLAIAGASSLAGRGAYDDYLRNGPRRPSIRRRRRSYAGCIAGIVLLTMTVLSAACAIILVSQKDSPELQRLMQTPAALAEKLQRPASPGGPAFTPTVASTAEAVVSATPSEAALAHLLPSPTEPAPVTIPSPTATATPSPSSRAAALSLLSPTPDPSGTPSATATATETATVSVTPTLPATATTTITALPPSPTATPDAMATATLAPSAAATPTPTAWAIARGELLFADDFAVNSAGWREGEANDGAGRFAFVDGRYRISSSRLNRVNYSTFGPDRRIGDFLLEVEAAAQDGPRTDGYGVFFRFVDEQNYGYFELTSRGSFRLLERHAGQWSVLASWTATSALRPGSNTLGILVQGSAITLYVNSTRVGTYTSPADGEGSIALAAAAYGEGTVDVAFDSLRVWAAP